MAFWPGNVFTGYGRPKVVCAANINQDFGMHAAIGRIQGVSATWPAANLALYTPILIEEPVTAYRLGWYNGATVSGNVNAAIYNMHGTQLVVTGSTAQTGASTIQEVDVTDTPLTPGYYYLALIMDNVTGTMFRMALNQMVCNALGQKQQSVGSINLPTTATFASLSQANIPLVFANCTPAAL
jgi:hypothetical protein